MNQRREFLGALGAVGLSWALPSFGGDETALLPVVPNSGPNGSVGRVVVVGGGMSGASMAKYLRLWGGTGVGVTLIEREPSYTTNITSNLVLNGSRQISDLVFQYDRLRGFGVDVRTGVVTGIDAVGRRISLAGGTTLPYDRLVLAPGIDFDVIPGLESAGAQARVPHAWNAGVQTTTLRDQLRAMRAGGTFIISIPLAPFRAATAPYERACIVADLFQRTNRSAKILVLDANAAIAGGSRTFTAAFAGPFQGMIEYVPRALVTAIDASVTPIKVTAMINGVSQVLSGDVVNAIPRQRAGRIVTQSGLGLANATDGRFAGVNVLSYESTVVPRIHVVGDSCASAPQPKAGHMGNQQGKVGADAIVRLLRGGPGAALDQSPATATVGFSPITAGTASWFTTVFQFQPPTPPTTAGVMVAASTGEAARPTDDNFEQLFKWFGELHADTLG